MENVPSVPCFSGLPSTLSSCESAANEKAESGEGILDPRRIAATGAGERQMPVAALGSPSESPPIGRPASEGVRQRDVHHVPAAKRPARTGVISRERRRTELPVAELCGQREARRQLAEVAAPRHGIPGLS